MKGLTGRIIGIKRYVDMFSPKTQTTPGKPVTQGLEMCLTYMCVDNDPNDTTTILNRIPSEKDPGRS